MCFEFEVEHQTFLTFSLPSEDENVGNHLKETGPLCNDQVAVSVRLLLLAIKFSSAGAGTTGSKLLFQ